MNWLLRSSWHADTLYIRVSSIPFPEHITEPRMSEVKVRCSLKFIPDHDYYRRDVLDFNEVVHGEPFRANGRDGDCATTYRWFISTSKV